MFISLSDVTKTYNRNKENEVQALRGIDLQIDRGQMISIVGPSGSGKSTLLNLLGCVDKATSGEFFLNGSNISKMTDKQLAELRNKSIGFVLQNFGLLPDRTVYENVSIPCLFSRGESITTRSRVIESLQSCGMEKYLHRTASQLSGGQQQRVAIARAVVMKPILLLADEPTGALDTSTADEIMELFRILNKNGTTIIIVTHNPTIADTCDRQYLLSDGRLQ